MSSVNYDLYEKDFYGWAMKNAQLLKDKKFDEIDIDHIVEEIKSMGESEKRQLESRFEINSSRLGTPSQVAT